MARKVGWTALAVLAACGGKVVEPGSSDASTSAAGGSGGAAVCVPAEGGAAPLQPTCADLGRLAVRQPALADESGDGKLAFQEKGTLKVILADVSGRGFNWYPGVRFTSATISIASDGLDQFYAVLPCGSSEASAGVSLLTSYPQGTALTVRAQVSALGLDCPDAPAIEVPVVVE